MKTPGSLLREPMLHFVVAGAVLYGAFALFRGPQIDTRDEATIVVDRNTLLTFMQYRANAFEPETFNAALDAMTDQELDELVAAYIREEVLYREAQALDLQASDYVIRQRMVQKMSFLMSDIADRSTARSESELAEYFAANADSYAIQPWVTFTHIFFDAQRRGESAVAAAEKLRDELNRNGTAFNDAPQHGDRFPFLGNYVERTYEYVASHFGYEFAEALADLPASEAQWQGPIRSEFGEHLVMVTAQVPRILPNLDQVRTEVERDLAAAHSREAIREITDAIRQRYQVVVRDIRSKDR